MAFVTRRWVADNQREGKMAEIVIIGAGIGGVPMAYEMKDQLKAGENLTVISNTPVFQFVPSNPWVVVGWRSRADTEIDLAPIMKKKGIEFIHAAVSKVDPGRNEVALDNGDTVTYDYLIIAAGPALAFDEIEGLGPDKNSLSVCTAGHAVAAAERWREFVKDPGPIVVGAAQGASCFGPAYEMACIMDTDLRKRRIRDRVPITFVTPEPYVGHLGLGGVGDSKGLLESELRKRHIGWICNAKLDKVGKDKVELTEHDDEGNPKKQHVIDQDLAAFIPAFRGFPAIAGIDKLANPRDFVIVDAHQRNPAYPNIFSIGVVIALPPVEATPVPTGCPKTGFMIESMVTATAHNIRDLLDGKEATHEGSLSAACLADFGDKGTAFVAIPQIPPRNVNWESSGRWVHWAKVAFEKYFMRKVRKGVSEPFYEKNLMKWVGLTRLKRKIL
jgi:sulfide:quinone oxidoreductase